jgi:predicted O-methyltransferase YrrM
MMPFQNMIFNFYQILRYKLNFERMAVIIKYVKKNQPSSILEIGVYKGDFALRMLSQISRQNQSTTKYCGIDLFSEMQTKENFQKEISMWPEQKDLVLKKIKDSYQNIDIELVQCYSSDFLSKEKHKYDLIFIDGGHSFPTVFSDWILSSSLLTQKGVIFFDDYTTKNGASKSSFGIRQVVEGIDRAEWKIKIYHNADYFKKTWGVLALKIAKVSKV